MTISPFQPQQRIANGMPSNNVEWHPMEIGHEMTDAMGLVYATVTDYIGRERDEHSKGFYYAYALNLIGTPDIHPQDAERLAEGMTPLAYFFANGNHYGGSWI